MPYAGVSNAVLIFQKGVATDNVWFYDMEAGGFSLENKRQMVSENDILNIIIKWRQSHPELVSGFRLFESNRHGFDSQSHPELVS